MSNIDKNLPTGKGGLAKPAPFNHNSVIPRIHSSGYEFNTDQINKDELHNLIGNHQPTQNQANVNKEPLQVTQTSQASTTNTTNIEKKPTLNLNANSFTPKVLLNKTTEGGGAYSNFAKQVSSFIPTGTQNYSAYIQSASIDVNSKGFISAPYQKLGQPSTLGGISSFPTTNSSLTHNPTPYYPTAPQPLTSNPALNTQSASSTHKLNLNLKSNAYVPKKFATEVSTNTAPTVPTSDNTISSGVSQAEQKTNTNYQALSNSNEAAKIPSFTSPAPVKEEDAAPVSQPQAKTEKEVVPETLEKEVNKVAEIPVQSDIKEDNQPAPSVKKEETPATENAAGSQSATSTKKSKLGGLFENKDVSYQVDTKNVIIPQKDIKDDKKNSKDLFMLKKKQADEERRIKELEEKKKNEEEKRLKDQEALKKKKEKEEREALELSIKLMKEHEEKMLREAEEKKRKEELELKPRIERQYFLVYDNQPKVINIMKIEYMHKFASLSICNKTDLLTDDTIRHLENMKIREEERIQQKYNNRQSYKGSKPMVRSEPKTIKDEPASSNIIRRAVKIDLSQPAPENKTLEKWGRRDLTAYVNEAEKQRELIIQARSEDTLKDELVDLLNKITVDTYPDTRTAIFNLVKDSTDAQNKLLDVLFNKALTGGTYVNLYAKLCKDLDKDLPQKVESKDNKPAQSLFRKSLLEKSKKIFALKNLDLDSQGNKEEQIIRLKKSVLGNVNFITELISTKVLSKSISFQCLNSLFLKLEKDVDQLQDKDVSRALQLMIIEAICILLDKFGTFINKLDKIIKPEVLEENNRDLDKQIIKIEKYVNDNSNSLPGHIQFKVINLIEKKKRGWELSEVDKLQKAKGLKELNEDSQAQNNNDGCQVSIEEVMKDLKMEISNYKDAVESESYKNWDTSTSLYNKGVNLATMAQAINDLCVDYVNNLKVAEIVCNYMSELFNYYKKDPDLEKKKLREKTLEIALNLSDTLLDNKLMSIIVGQLLVLTYNFYNLRVSDFDNLDINEEQASGIFEAVKSTMGLKSETLQTGFKDSFSKLKLVEKYRNLYESIVNK